MPFFCARDVKSSWLFYLLVSRRTVVAIENDKYAPSLEPAMKHSRLLETTAEGLFTLREEG